MSARSKRIDRIKASMPFVATLRAHESEVDHVWWSRHDSHEDRALWLVTPISHGDREQDTLADSNYEVTERLLTDASGFGEVGTRYDLWPGGRIETLLIRADDALAIRKLEQIVDALENHPVLDEEHYSALEYERNHPSYDECYADEDCGCEVRNHDHRFSQDEISEDGEAWCDICRECVRPGTRVVHGELRRGVE